jgi:hypothetical protein
VAVGLGLEGSEALLRETVKKPMDCGRHIKRRLIVFVRLADDDAMFFIHFLKLTIESACLIV